MPGAALPSSPPRTRSVAAPAPRARSHHRGIAIAVAVLARRCGSATRCRIATDAAAVRRRHGARRRRTSRARPGARPVAPHRGRSIPTSRCGSGSAATRSPVRSVPRSATMTGDDRRRRSRCYDSRSRAGSRSAATSTGREHADEEMAQLDPEAVVFIIGTNDADRLQRRDDESRREEYASSSTQMMHAPHR